MSSTSTYKHQKLASEIRYFIPFIRRKFKNQRRTLWEKHVSIYARIKQGKEVVNNEWKSDRIDFLTNHLNILDGKFITLLQFHGLMGVAVSILIVPSRDIISHHAIIATLTVMFISLWLSNLFMTLLSNRYVVWGDLWKESDIVTAEREHVDALIDTVIMRTAIFRLVSLTTIFESIFLFATVIILFYITLGF